MTTEQMGRFTFVDRERPEDEIAVELTEDVSHTFRWYGGLSGKYEATWRGKGYTHWLPESAANELIDALPHRFKQAGKRSWQQVSGRWIRPGGAT